MNNERRTNSYTGWFVLIFFIGISVFACKKTGPTQAVITVIDRTNAAVQGAKVTLWQDTAVNATNGIQSKLRVTKTTDAAGRAEFDFELEAFLNIESAWRDSPPCLVQSPAARRVNDIETLS